MLLSLILLVFGFVLLVRGADYFVDGASALATRLHIGRKSGILFLGMYVLYLIYLL